MNEISKKKKSIINIVPFLERKLMCVNDELLKDSKAFDLDFYCLSNIGKDNYHLLTY